MALLVLLSTAAPARIISTDFGSLSSNRAPDDSAPSITARTGIDLCAFATADHAHLLLLFFDPLAIRLLCRTYFLLGAYFHSVELPEYL